MVKDLKRSIWAKYGRRKKSLYFSLEDFIHHSEDRLDKERAGDIRNRKETESLLEKARELFDMLPEPKELSFEEDDDIYIEDILDKTT